MKRGKAQHGETKKKRVVVVYPRANECVNYGGKGGGYDRSPDGSQSPQLEETRASQIGNVLSEGKGGVKGETQISNTGGVGKGGKFVGQ